MLPHQSVYLLVAILIAQLGVGVTTERGPSAAYADSEASTHFVSHGKGEPVVLVHGFSQTHEIWIHTPLFEYLARNYRVIAVDLRGHGNSSKPHDPRDYGPNLGADLLELLDHLGVDKAHFVGFSLGANVVGDIVISNPERVLTATMAGGLFTTWDDSEEDFARLTEAREANGERSPWEPENQDYEALAALIRGARYSAVRPEQIASVSTPTLIVFGSIEVDNMTESRKNQLETMSGSIRVRIIDGADHDSEKAAILNPEFAQAVAELIASNPTN